MSRDTGQGTRIDLYAAARGERVATVRKRIQRGQLRAAKGADRRWYVLDDDATRDATGRDTRQDATGHATADATGLDSPAGRQLAAIRDQWLAPLVAQITEQAERIGRLEAERDAALERARVAEEERDQRRAQAAPPPRPTAVDTPTVAPTVATPARRSWWPWGRGRG
jgi:hypothetical protein